MKDDAVLIATHRKAFRDYHILESLEAGIMLLGPEIKSIRSRHVSLEDSFARIEDEEVFLYNMHVNPYEQGGRYNAEPMRARKLLLHRNQIDRLNGLLTQKGFTLVPLRLYLKGGLAKLDLGVVKGRKLYEKRDLIKQREIDRELRRLTRHRQKHSP